MAVPLPSTKELILSTAWPDQAFTVAHTEKGEPKIPDDLAALKAIVQGSLSSFQSKLANDRPSNIVEAERTISLGDGIESRIIVCHSQIPSKPSPLIVLYHGGGYCIAFPEAEVKFARQLAITYSATVVCPSVRLAPEHPFPASINDGWAVLKYLAKEATSPHNSSNPILPAETDPTAGFIVGGTSSGANLASVLAHLARDNALSPPLTGQFLCAGGYIDQNRVPEKYKPLYLSYDQNANAPLLTRDFLLMFRAALKPDPDSALWAPFDQHHSADAPGEVKEGHMGLPPAHFQICGMDLSRDDGLIYEKVLREECGVPTRVDLYAGYPHCWWNVYPDIERSKRREEDAVAAFGWLLSFGGGKKSV